MGLICETHSLETTWEAELYNDSVSVLPSIWLSSLIEFAFKLRETIDRTAPFVSRDAIQI
jgi:hypothetical protein